MAINKVEYDGRVLIDLTSDTVTPSTLMEGYVAHDKSGKTINGTLKSGDSMSYGNGSTDADNVTVNKDKIDALADVISAKSDTATPMTIDELVTAVDGIEVCQSAIADESTVCDSYTGCSDSCNAQTKTISPSEERTVVTPDSGYDALSSVTVEAIDSNYVGSSVTRQGAKTITPSTSVQTAVNANVYTTGAIKVAAIPSQYIVPSGTKTITANGTEDVKAYENVTVNVQPTLQSKTATPTESEQTISPDSNYDGLSSVKVGAISSTYVGSGITKDPTPTVSGATVTIPQGYYSAKTTKSVASGSAKTPTTSITANPSISVSNSGLITASASGSKSITPTVSAGYVSSGTAGTVSVSGSNTKQLTTQSAKTITPTKSTQTAVAKGVYTTGAVTVGAIPSEYITTTDATATASDIVSGETAYVNGSKVTGTLVVQKYYTGSSAPSSSLGNNGDIYLQV